MNLRKQTMAWVLAALCVPGLLRANDSDGPKASVEEGVRLQVGAQDVLIQNSDVRPQTVTVVTDDDRAPLSIAVTVDDQLQKKKLAEADAQSKYWLGLMCSAPSDALRAQVELPKDIGLVVDEVYEGGPAKKAGLLRYDVLISSTTVVGEKEDVRSLKNLLDLVNAVQAAETNAMKIEFLRRGKKQTVEVVPAERPKEQYEARLDLGTASPDLQAVLSRSADGVGLRWAGPMVVNLRAEPLPDGMTIEFQPAEGEPKAVVVKRKDEVWATDIKSLDKLPEEIAVLVKQQLHLRGPQTARLFGSRTIATGNVIVTRHGTAFVLPDDVTVTTVRKGSDPLKISIKKGDQAWEVNEKDLSTLPMEVRRYAEMTLAGQLNDTVPFTRIVTVPPAPVIPPKYVPQTDARPPKASHTTVAPPQIWKTATVTDRPLQNQQEIERQLKELSEQVEKLRQAVEKTQPKQ